MTNSLGLRILSVYPRDVIELKYGSNRTGGMDLGQPASKLFRRGISGGVSLYIAQSNSPIGVLRLA
jgi:hypothetical protein